MGICGIIIGTLGLLNVIHGADEDAGLRPGGENRREGKFGIRAASWRRAAVPSMTKQPRSQRESLSI